VKTGIFPKEFSRWLHDAFDLRQRSDYTVKYVPTMEEANEIFENAVTFVKQVKKKIGRKE